MSKAFTREDDLPDLPTPVRLASSLPPGAKNYLTADGERCMRAELDRLVQVERPRFAALPEASDERRQLPGVEQRILQLEQCLRSAVVVPPPSVTEDRVRFGATVMVRERGGAESSYRIVGVDEMDVDRGWVSYLSPIAKALLNARIGQRVRFRFPSGEEELEIVGIKYE